MGKGKNERHSFTSTHITVTNFGNLVTGHASMRKRQERVQRAPTLLGDHTVVAGEHHVL
uniref:Uncharacterized protein n=1 Tax=Oryza brachyantha TaxID=4533 RepID=J3L249_ORYBR